MSTLSEPNASSIQPDPGRAITAVTGTTTRQVSGAYARRVLLPGVIAVLLTPVFGPLGWVLDGLVYQFVADYDTAKTASNWLMVLELIAGGVLYVIALVSTVRLGRQHHEDRIQHEANGSRAWHALSIVMIIVLSLIPVALVLCVLALAMAFSALNSGL